MGVLNSLFTFVGSMNLSALIIIGAILVIFAAALSVSIMLRARYAKLQSELARQADVGRAAAELALGPDGPQGDRFSEPRFRSPPLRDIAAEYNAAWNGNRGSEVNTPAIIENYFNRHMRLWLLMERLARHSVSVMIVLGLLGTFIGLTVSVQSLVLLFRDSDAAALLSSVESGLLSALAGMSTAFTTSLFGIACSVIITVLNIFLSVGHMRERLMTGIEEYLDNTAAARLKTAAGDAYERMNDALRRTFVDFGEKIATRFDRSLVTMRDDVRGINEANASLRNTIELMNVSTTRIAEAIRESTHHIDDNYQVLGGLSGQFQAMLDEYEAGRVETADYSKRLMKSVTEAAEAVTALTSDLRGETRRRLDNFETYDAAIARMAESAELIRAAVAAIPQQMYAYAEASALPERRIPGAERRFGEEDGGTGGFV